MATARQAKNDVFTWHQIRIAINTLKLSDEGAFILGGMTKEEARSILKRANWSSAKIERLEKGE